MVLLAKAKDEFPDFDPERPPKTPVSPHLRWAVQRAPEDHALHRMVCYPRAKSVSVRCELQGWDDRWFECNELYMRGVHHDAGLDLHAVALAGDLSDLYMREGPLPDVFWNGSRLGPHSRRSSSVVPPFVANFGSTDE